MNERFVRVQGRATVKAVPDEVVIHFEVSARDPVYARAVELLNERTERLRSDLGGVGVARGDLKTTQFAVNTLYRSVHGRDVFDCYEASHGLAVHLPMKREILNRVLVTAAQSASQAQFRLSFGVKDETPLRQQALEKAVAAAKQNAATLARAAGISLGALVRIEYGWTEVRVRSGGEYRVTESMVAPDITPGDVAVEDSVAIVWEIAP